jgi:hypothetical protein
MGKTKRRKRDFWSAYYRTQEVAENGKAILWGAEIMHSTNKGKFIQDGEEWYLFKCYLCKDDLPDTQGKNQEAFDFHPGFGDEIINDPVLVQMVMSESLPDNLAEVLLTRFSDSVVQLLLSDLESGLSPFEIVEKRIGILVSAFMGFTYEEVVTANPEIVQPVEVTDEEGNISINSNIWA